MPVMDYKVISSKFRGCLLGSLLGDCLGAPFEGETLGAGAKVVLQKYFDKLDGPLFKAPVKQYTDDTAMTKCVAKSLISQGTINQTDLARRFVKEYFTEPKRGYGAGVVDVFQKLRVSQIADPTGPAKEQFDGTGSYGNGAAMRVAPVALFGYENYDSVIKMARESSEITHTHELGVHGAILQAIAVHKCFNLNSNETIDPAAFTHDLINRMDKIELAKDTLGLEQGQPYKIQLAEVKRLILNPQTSDAEVDSKLGNSIAAIYSVPTAIYCFLKGLNPIAGINSDNPFRRTLQYAISLGGDTDTIASMAGALSGAYFGEDIISKNILRHCESTEEVIKIANDLLEARNLRFG